MAPNPRVADAFRAMKSLGITADVVKPVLKNLVQVYENNWDFIEEENYRALVDAIFEKQEGQVAQVKKRTGDADAQIAERKKKRWDEDAQVVESKKKHPDADLEQNEEAEVHGEPERPLKRLRLRFQENIVSSTSGGSVPGLGENSKHLQIQTGNNSYALLRPKDEPVTEDLPPLEVPITSILPEQRSHGALDPSCERGTNCERVSNADESSWKLELASTASGEVKISMSCIPPQGRPDFHVPSLDELFKRTGDKCLRKFKFLYPSFSVRQILNELCACALELGNSTSGEFQEEIHVTPAYDSSSKSTAVDVEAIKEMPVTPKGSIHTQGAVRIEESEILYLPPTSNGMGHGVLSVHDFTGKDCGDGKDNEQNGMENASSHKLMVVEHLMPLETRTQIFVIDDISKALETVLVSLVNDVNNELPPAFRYIPSNIKFENADVNFSLARIGDSFCSTCFGDCVSIPCTCTHASGGVVYTVEGLVKEDFLEECISINRDFPRPSLSHCKDCPLERSKQEDAKEGCKGHLVRKFIKECWWKCGCNGRCGNRVVQHGIKSKLQAFMTSNGKGWGLRTLEDLPKGMFVCEFAGEILTIKELYARVSQSSSIEKHEFPVLLDADWGPRAMNDEEALCLDATYYGNVARFINHRCFDPNLVGIPVEVDTPRHHYYRFAFFTTRKVNAFEELTRDYGIDFDDHGNLFKTFECLCESKFCRNLRRMTRSRSAKRRG